MLVDYKLEIRKLSVQLQTRIETWIRQESAYGESEELRADKEVPLETAYVLRCPKLHVVPEHVLKSRIALDGHVSLFSISVFIFLEPGVLHVSGIVCLARYYFQGYISNYYHRLSSTILNC